MFKECLSYSCEWCKRMKSWCLLNFATSEIMPLSLKLILKTTVLYKFNNFKLTCEIVRFERDCLSVFSISIILYITYEKAVICM